jgi:hypothetical protein
MHAGYTESAAREFDLPIIRYAAFLGVGLKWILKQINELIDVGGLRMVEFQRC